MFVVSAGSCSPLQWGGNGHYYELIDTNPANSSGFTLDEVNAALSTPPVFMGLSGHLVTITSQAEQDFISNFILNGNNTPQYWIAASDAAAEGTWRWTAGPEAGQELIYFNWFNNEPSNTGGNEDFVVANWVPLGQWNDVTTFRRAAYVVEYSQTQAIPTLALLPGLVGFMMAFKRKKQVA